MIRQFRFAFRSSSDCRWGMTLKISYISLQLIDLVLTIFARSLGLHELNPLINSLLDTPLQLLGFKLAIPLLIVWLVPGKLLIPAVLFIAMIVGLDIKELLVFLL